MNVRVILSYKLNFRSSKSCRFTSFPVIMALFTPKSLGIVKFIRTIILPQLKVWLFLPFFTCALGILSILVIFPFFIYRRIVLGLAKFQDPQVTRVLTGLSASLVRDFDCHSTKPRSTIVICMKSHGTLTCDQFIEQLRDKIVLRKRHQKNGQSGERLQFPELQQFYKIFMGYVFLRWDMHFDLRNHVKLHKSVVKCERELMEIWQDLMIAPFQREQSPWEAVFVEMFQDPESGMPEQRNFVVFLRIHHGIADGLSVQQMLCSLDPTYVWESSTSQSGSLTKVVKNFLLNFHGVLTGPYQLLTKMTRFKESYHSLHLPIEEQSKEYYVVESPLMSIESIKQIKRKFGVAFTTILLAVLTGGIKRFLEENNLPFPKLQCFGIPFAANTGLVDRLRNDFLIAPFNVPIQSVQPLERIMNIQCQLDALHYSALPKMLGWSIDMLSCLPVKLMCSLTRKSVFSTAYSTLPGPRKRITLPGAQLDEVNFTYGTGVASLGLCFSSITYLGKLRMTIFVDKKLLPGENWQKAQEMIECVTNEYQALYEIAEVMQNK